MSPGIPSGSTSCSIGDGEQAEEISYGALREEARRIASGLVGRGLQPKQTVALMLPTSRDYLASFFGVMLAGGVPVPIYPPARLSQIEDHLRRHARILDNADSACSSITVSQAKTVALLLRAAVPSLHDIVTPQELSRPAVPHRATVPARRTSPSCNTRRAAPAIRRASSSRTPTCSPTCAPWAKRRG